MRTGYTLSTVRLLFMFPAIESVLSELNFEQIRKTDEKYWRLLGIERRYCRKHAEQIHELAYKKCIKLVVTAIMCYITHVVILRC